MGKKKKWEDFVSFVRSASGPDIKKFMKEALDEDMENFLFLANSEEPGGIIIRGMHFPDSDLLDAEGVTVFETSEERVYIAAYRKSTLEEIMQIIQETLPEKYHDAIWEKAMEKLLSAAEQKIEAGEIRAFM
jgi:hypothetical protein